jgi:hypothetical protein
MSLLPNANKNGTVSSVTHVEISSVARAIYIRSLDLGWSIPHTSPCRERSSAWRNKSGPQ